MATPVIFKREREGRGVYAVFPTIPGDYNPCTMSCYAHVGQHSVAHRSYVATCRPAKPAEYVDLLSELRSIGYDDLVVRKRMSHADYKAREAELRLPANV